MRISDWSSDVCSSDLARPAALVAPFEAGLEVPQLQPRVERTPVHQHDRPAHRPLAGVGLHRSEERRVGKSVSVRLDLGGRRIIKKKKNNATYRTRIYIQQKNNITNSEQQRNDV